MSDEGENKMTSKINFSYSKQDQKYKKYKEKAAMIRIIVSLLVILSLAIVIVEISEQSQEMNRLDLENRELNEKLELAKQEQNSIQDLEKKVGTNEFIEQIARDELGLVTLDEYIFIED